MTPGQISRMLEGGTDLQDLAESCGLGSEALHTLLFQRVKGQHVITSRQRLDVRGRLFFFPPSSSVSGWQSAPPMPPSQRVADMRRVIPSPATNPNPCHQP